MPQHRKLAKSITIYVRVSKLFSYLTAPVIWIVLVPVVLIQAMVAGKGAFPGFVRAT